MSQHFQLQCLVLLVVIVIGETGSFVPPIECTQRPPPCTTKKFYFNFVKSCCQKISTAGSCSRSLHGRWLSSQPNAFDTLLECKNHCIGKLPFSSVGLSSNSYQVRYFFYRMRKKNYFLFVRMSVLFKPNFTKLHVYGNINLTLSTQSPGL